MSEPDATMEARLEAELRANASALGVDRITRIHRFTSGLSSQSYGVSAETSSGPTQWVMRVEPKHGVIPPYDITREYRLLRETFNAGLPVPEMLYLGEDASVVGGRFLLMSFIEGVIYSSRDPRIQGDDALRADVQEKFVQMLARIHDTPQTTLASYTSGKEAALAHIATCRDRLSRIEILPSPPLRHALDVLEQNAPDAQKICLVHGDYRLPNLMWHDGEISGILDWELALVGDPLSDLAFTQTVGAGPCSIEGPLAQRYSEITGIEIDERKIAYYKLLEMVKSTIIGLGGANDVLKGGTDLRMLSVATIASSGQGMFAAFEAQLEHLLEA
jgi:aminoglycoside phosphotransferase (APT) family kinase protein